jgi:hypothetical protein
MDSRRELPELSELEALLVRRGWTIFDRATGRAMYDWPPSFDNAEGEVTYLMIDEVDHHQLGRYRVSCVDGERQTFDDDASLVAALDRIEARRA